MSEAQLNQWTIDFAQAKIASRNLEVSVHTSATYQTEAVSRLKESFSTYSEFAVEGASAQRSAELTEQINLSSRVERNMHISTSKFEGKAKAQIDAARMQVSASSTALGKLKSMKPPQYIETSRQSSQQIPGFLDLFDSFLARFTLQIRLQQADFYKQWGDAFTYAGQQEPIPEIREAWQKQFNQIMPALEVMKLVNPHVKATSPTSSHSSDHSGVSGGRIGLGTEKVDSVLLAPVKWIHSKISKDLKHFQFSDPRMGFFNKPTQPPAHHEEKVRALYDFSGETDSDSSFKKGDVIRIVDKGTEDDPNWWCGDLNGRRGLFPRNYVTGAVHEEEHDPDEYVPRIPRTSSTRERRAGSEEPVPASEGLRCTSSASSTSRTTNFAEERRISNSSENVGGHNGNENPDRIRSPEPAEQTPPAMPARPKRQNSEQVASAKAVELPEPFEPEESIDTAESSDHAKSNEPTKPEEAIAHTGSTESTEPASKVGHSPKTSEAKSSDENPPATPPRPHKTESSSSTSDHSPREIKDSPYTDEAIEAKVVADPGTAAGLEQREPKVEHVLADSKVGDEEPRTASADAEKPESFAGNQENINEAPEERDASQESRPNDSNVPLDPRDESL